MIDSPIKNIVLSGEYVRLEPLCKNHNQSLMEAVIDGSLWELWYTFIPKPEDMSLEIDRRLALQAQGKMLPFVVIDQIQNKIVGMTTYMNIDQENNRVEIGSTWYSKSAQKTRINTESKFLLLAHAFETLKCIAVEFRTHRANLISQRAIERLGAKLDGVLRQHQMHRHPGAQGLYRDTYVYSIINSEWLSVKTKLQELLLQ
jgi:hypothetical protein